MPVKVEMHADVVLFVRHRCTPEETDEFFRKLHKVRERPLASSEAHADPHLSRYVLRCFRFGRGVEKIAIFAYEPAEDRIRVLKCRLARPRRLRDRGDNGESP